MDISGFIDIAKMVLSDRRVIVTAVVVFLCMNFGVFVEHYTKKPAKPKRVHAAKPAPAVPAAEGENGEEGTASDGNAEQKG